MLDRPDVARTVQRRGYAHVDGFARHGGTAPGQRAVTPRHHGRSRTPPAVADRAWRDAMTPRTTMSRQPPGPCAGPDGAEAFADRAAVARPGAAHGSARRARRAIRAACEISDRDEIRRLPRTGSQGGLARAGSAPISVVNRSGDRWVGTLGVRELFARKGKVIDVCQVKRVRFTLR